MATHLNRKLLLLMMASTCLPASAEDKRIRPIVRATCTGKLNHGVFAIGGETTGTEIRIGEIVWELDFKADRKLRGQATQWNGTTISVSGKLERRKGVEVPERWILLVDEFAEVKTRKPKPTIEIDAIGQVRTGIVAIGGETTGTEILAGRILWEIRLGEKMRDAARPLHGKLARVKGVLTRKKGVEFDGYRWIIEAKSLAAPKPEKRR